MLQLLDESLEDFLRAEVGLTKDEVDIVFEAPDDEWRAGVTKPTVNLFLWDIRRSTDEASAGREQIEKDGTVYWRMRPPRMVFRYLCTAWTNEVQDEHRLLGLCLAAFLANRSLPEQYLKGVVADMEPGPTVRVAAHDAKDFAEFWSALEGQLKPGLDLIVSAVVDPNVLVPAGEPTEDVGFRTSDVNEPDRTSETRRVGGRIEDPEAVGAVVRSPRGSTVVGDEGEFLIPAEPGDEIVVETADPVTMLVGADGTLAAR